MNNFAFQNNQWQSTQHDRSRCMPELQSPFWLCPAWIKQLLPIVYYLPLFLSQAKNVLLKRDKGTGSQLFTTQPGQKGISNVVSLLKQHKAVTTGRCKRNILSKELIVNLLYRIDPKYVKLG